MYNPFLVLIILFSYFGLLYLIAFKVEYGGPKTLKLINNPYVYSLSLAIYCTSWTFYGSVGNAVNNGLSFLAIYIGPTIGMTLWWVIVRKLVRIKNQYRITSIADFISARYDKSGRIAVIATIIALVGITPYLGLQIKVVLKTFSIIANVQGEFMSTLMTAFILILLMFFTILVGVKRLDPTERHQGMIAALAIQCLVKLFAFFTVGIFVTYFVFDGANDIFVQLSQSAYTDLLTIKNENSTYFYWGTLIILSASAMLLLPRQFHVAVIENSNENHLKTGMWVLPLYLFLINLFVIPVAAGGLLSNLGPAEADTFVLSIPILLNKPIIAFIVFIGGFSAAAGMLMISSMTLATMLSNHIFLQIINRVESLSGLRKHILEIRWISVVTVILLGFGFEREIGNSFMIANIGMMSFAAVLQFAPPIIGGILWKNGNQKGAMTGLLAGFIVWLYTLLLPAIIKSGWLSNSILTDGPFGIWLLRPESLFGIEVFNSLTNGVFWSMIFNCGFYVFISLYFPQTDREKSIANNFVTILDPVRESTLLDTTHTTIILQEKIEIVKKIFSNFFKTNMVEKNLELALVQTGIKNKTEITIIEMVTFARNVENLLSGIIGAATAKRLIDKSDLFSKNETADLSLAFQKIVANLHLTPNELRNQIENFQEKERVLKEHADELEQYKIELEKQIKSRTQQLEATNKELETFAYSVSHDLRAPIRHIEGYTKILYDSIDNPKSEKTEKYFTRISVSIAKMNSLIEALLNLSRLSQQRLTIKDINLSEIVEQIALSGDEPSWAKVKFVIQSNCICKGDYKLLHIVLENLLNNAVKFSSKIQNPEIEFGQLEKPEESDNIVFFIKDNGIGFDMHYAEKLFGAFQRLHNPDDFEGTGIGLATVQRIINRHGGKIWAKSSPNNGATFYFTLS